MAAVGFELTTPKRLGSGVQTCQEAFLQHIFIAIKLLAQLCNGWSTEWISLILIANHNIDH
jgi:hypothetical protein